MIMIIVRLLLEGDSESLIGIKMRQREPKKLENLEVHLIKAPTLIHPHDPRYVIVLH
jgi:hypothetical protein